MAAVPEVCEPWLLVAGAEETVVKGAGLERFVVGGTETIDRGKRDYIKFSN